LIGPQRLQCTGMCIARVYSAIVIVVIIRHDVKKITD
jgi:hypothetical protein